MSAKSRGSARERMVADRLRDEDWFVVKVGGSLGAADLLATRASHLQPEVLLVQVKSDVRGPFAHFGPEARAELRTAARKAGGRPVLAWWPPRGKLRWFGEDEWPVTVGVWCEACGTRTLPLRDGCCGFCETRLEQAA